MPVYGTIASQFNDPATNNLYSEIISTLNRKKLINYNFSLKVQKNLDEKNYIIPPKE